MSDDRANVLPFPDSSVEETEFGNSMSAAQRIRELAGRNQDAQPVNIYLGNGGGDGGDGLKERITKLESEVAHIKTDVGKIEATTVRLEKKLGDQFLQGLACAAFLLFAGLGTAKIVYDNSNGKLTSTNETIQLNHNASNERFDNIGTRLIDLSVRQENLDNKIDKTVRSWGPKLNEIAEWINRQD